MESTSTPVTSSVNDPRVIRAWTMFDWANSSYSLVISAAIFPAYYLSVIPEKISVLGIQTTNSALYAYAITLAYIIMALVSPALSGIADYGGMRKSFLRFFTTVGALACIAMLFFRQAGQIYFGTSSFILATVGFAGGLVFYNSYLPEIVTTDRYDEVSARGFSMGYIGSVLLLLACLLIIQKYDWFGFVDSAQAVPVSFLLVGLWWLGFAQITFRAMPKDEPLGRSHKLIAKGFHELAKTWRAVKQAPHTLRYLSAFFFYSAGAQTVLFLASAFAGKELKFETQELILLILILQIVGIAGAYLFAYISKLKGNKFSLVSILIIWVIVCVTAYFSYTKLSFYGVAALFGMVMGGIQSMSRSTYSKLLPEHTEDTTSYFSFYDVLEKLAIILGTFCFGYMDQLTGSMRSSVLVIIVFFVIGLGLLLTVTVEPGRGKWMSG